MTHIVGVVCDGCGKSDVISASVMKEQSVPRRNWISLSFWSGEDKGLVRTPEIHACSADCLQKVTEKVVKSAIETNNAERQEE